MHRVLLRVLLFGDHHKKHFDGFVFVTISVLVPMGLAISFYYVPKAPGPLRGPCFIVGL